MVHFDSQMRFDTSSKNNFFVYILKLCGSTSAVHSYFKRPFFLKLHSVDTY